MPNDIHHLSFKEHLALYLPHFLRPSLRRDLRHLPSVGEVEAPPASMASPLEHNSLPGDERQVQEGPSSRRSDTHSHTHHGPEPDAECEMEEEVGANVKSAREVVKEKQLKDGPKEGHHVSLVLTNSGSVARDHLASERTFLAYVRTSLALSSTGVALVQLFTIANGSGTLHPAQEVLVRRFATPLGSTMIILGLITLLFGYLRYFAIQIALTRGVFPAARLTVVFLAVTLSVLTGIVFGVLLKGRKEAL